MQTRKFDELISYFNRKVADMDIDINYKMELLGMVTALGCAHEKELHNPTIEPQRTGKWIYNSPVTMKCNQCGFVIKDWDWHRFKHCPNCGAKMQKPEDDIPMEYFESGGR